MSERKKKFSKTVSTWCKKWLRSGHPWDGHKTSPASEKYKKNYDKIDWGKK